jgi:acetylornithine/succinyldiaminopimelate/putrescine aminotransferase
MVELDAEGIDTNIVIFGVRGDWMGFARAMKRAGVLSTVTAPGRLRMVTHYGIERADVEEALDRVRHAAAALSV